MDGHEKWYLYHNLRVATTRLTSINARLNGGANSVCYKCSEPSLSDNSLLDYPNGHRLNACENARMYSVTKGFPNRDGWPVGLRAIKEYYQLS